MTATASPPSRMMAVLGLSVLLFGRAEAVLSPDAVDALKAEARVVLEVKVLDVEAPDPSGERHDVIYHMKVLSVLRATTSVTPGETIRVRSYGVGTQTLEQGFVGPKLPARLEPGWIGTAYLNQDSRASGPDAVRQFEIAAHGDSFVELPPGPPSLRYSVPPDAAR